MKCDVCYFNQYYNGFQRCMSKGIYLWDSQTKEENEKFCASFKFVTDSQGGREYFCIKKNKTSNNH